MDADMLCLCDIHELLGAATPLAAVSVAQHQQKFEWASLMVFNNGACLKLTPDFIDNEANNPFSFSWAPSVGNLQPEYNHCVGYDAPMEEAKIVHFTQGIPCFPETEDSEYRDAWMEEYDNCRFTVPWEAIMGNSVHESHVLKRYAKRLSHA